MASHYQAYCFWGDDMVFAPFYGAAFVSEFLGSGSSGGGSGDAEDDDATRIAMLDDGSGPVAVYAVFAGTNESASRLLVINTNYYDGSGGSDDTAAAAAITTSATAMATRENVTVSFTNLRGISISRNDISGSGGMMAGTKKRVKRLTAPDATSQVGEGVLAGAGEGGGQGGGGVAIGGDGVFGSDCIFTGGERTEEVVVNGNKLTMTISASEALIVYL